MTIRDGIRVFLAMLLVAGCGFVEQNDPVDGPSDSFLGRGKADSGGIEEGTPEALGVLQLVNTASFESLDNSVGEGGVGLDNRAAKNIVDYRVGDDGEEDTLDDESFDTLAELDAIPFVGPIAFGKMLDYARENGLVPSGNDLLGVYDGVSFTVDEAKKVLTLVNLASEQELGQQVGLDQRAVYSILEARPITSILKLAGCYFVGKASLERLKAYTLSDNNEAEVGIISDLDRTVIPPDNDNLSDGPYAGVAALYNELEFCNEGLPGDVYYVTARQPERVEGVPEWLEYHGLPLGPIETGISGVPWIARAEKVADISRILEAHPEQSFILFGDTNHQDPEVFHDIVASFSGRITALLIHNVNNCTDENRLQDLFPYNNYAQAAAQLFGIGVLDETSTRGVMKAAQLQGLDITDEEIDKLIEQNR